MVNQANEVKLYHCSKCNNMIAKSKNLSLTGELTIKCPKCDTFNKIESKYSKKS